MRLIWLIGGLLSFGLGVIGIVVPLLPTVPLILLAAFCFAKSSPRLHNWLLAHKTFGPMIHDWRKNGAINRRAKYMATASIALVYGISLIMGLPMRLLIIQAAVLIGVLIFIWTRPD